MCLVSIVNSITTGFLCESFKVTDEERLVRYGLL